MQILIANPDGNAEPKIGTVPDFPSIAEYIAFGIGASSGGRIAVLGANLSVTQPVEPVAESFYQLYAFDGRLIATNIV